MPLLCKRHSFVDSALNLFLNLHVFLVDRWSTTPVVSRVAIMNRIADLIEANLDSLAEAESTDQGKPISLSKRMDIPRAALNFRAFAETVGHQLNM